MTHTWNQLQPMYRRNIWTLTNLIVENRRLTIMIAQNVHWIHSLTGLYKKMYYLLFFSRFVNETQQCLRQINNFEWVYGYQTERLHPYVFFLPPIPLAPLAPLTPGTYATKKGPSEFGIYGFLLKLIFIWWNQCVKYKFYSLNYSLMIDFTFKHTYISINPLMLFLLDQESIQSDTSM